MTPEWRKEHPFIGNIYRIYPEEKVVSHHNSIFQNHNDGNELCLTDYEDTHIKNVVCGTYEDINNAIADFKKNKKSLHQKLRIITKLSLNKINEDGDINDSNIIF